MGLLVERRPKRGKFSRGIRWGAWGRPKWAKGPTRWPAHPAMPHQACGISPTLPGEEVGSPLGAYIRRGSPGLLIHQLIPEFSLDFVIPFVGVAPT